MLEHLAIEVIFGPTYNHVRPLSGQSLKTESFFFHYCFLADEYKHKLDLVGDNDANGNK